MHAVPDMAQGLALAEELARRHFGFFTSEKLDILIVPHALSTLPKLAS
jgi:hypothetical protein